MSETNEGGDKNHSLFRDPTLEPRSPTASWTSFIHWKRISNERRDRVLTLGVSLTCLEPERQEMKKVSTSPRHRTPRL